MDNCLIQILYIKDLRLEEKKLFVHVFQFYCCVIKCVSFIVYIQRLKVTKIIRPTNNNDDVDKGKFNTLLNFAKILYAKFVLIC